MRAIEEREYSKYENRMSIRIKVGECKGRNGGQYLRSKAMVTDGVSVGMTCPKQKDRLPSVDQAKGCLIHGWCAVLG